jgi:hypothetical protein
VGCLVAPHLPKMRPEVGPHLGIVWPPRRPLRRCYDEMLTSAFISSNFENISYTIFLKYKKKLKTGTDIVASYQ